MGGVHRPLAVVHTLFKPAHYKLGSNIRPVSVELRFSYCGTIPHPLTCGGRANRRQVNS
jgi:hypothetical protein